MNTRYDQKMKNLLVVRLLPSNKRYWKNHPGPPGTKTINRAKLVNLASKRKIARFVVVARRNHEKWRFLATAGRPEARLEPRF